MATTSDPNLRAWWIKQLQAREDAIGGRASAKSRQRWADEAAARGEALPPHISNLMDAVANSEAPIRDKVLAEVEIELQRRLAAHKEKSHA